MVKQFLSSNFFARLNFFSSLQRALHVKRIEQNCVSGVSENLMNHFRVDCIIKNAIQFGK